MSVMPHPSEMGTQAHELKLAKGESIAGFVLGVCSVVFGVVPLLGLVSGIVGLILSEVGFRRDKLYSAEIRKTYKGLSIAGIPCSIVGIVLGFIATVWAAYSLYMGHAMWIKF
ncbi:MAG: hypothetical protein ACE15C_10175 [Phycisphaerae bacterium]